MKIIVVFDVMEEYREVRDELRRFLKDLGGRFLQYSVYEVDGGTALLETLRRGVEKIISKGGGRVDILIPCKRCYSRIKTFTTYEL